MRIDHTTREFQNDGYDYAYHFRKNEKEAIARSLKHEIKRLEKIIDRALKSPRNEGQATYDVKIEDAEKLINFCNEMIELFTKHLKK